MTNSYPCPVCGQTATLEGDCPGCGRAPDHDAAAVIRIDARIGELVPQVESVQRTYAELSNELTRLRNDREVHATAVRMSTTFAKAPALTAPPAPRLPEGPAKAEASPRTVQNILFVLGGLLLGIGAIVFSVLAYNNLPPAGRAMILALFTMATLTVPPLVRRRGLTATAETFAALGLLLVLLDGYLAWITNLGDVRGSWDLAVYQGVVCGVVAVLGFGYGKAVKLIGPGIIGLIAAQPVLPLLFAEVTGRLVGRAVLFGAAAAFNLAVIRFSTGVLRSFAWIGYAGMMLISATFTLVAVSDAFGKLAVSGTMLMWAGLVVLAAIVARNGQLKQIAGGIFTFVLAAALVLPLLEQWPDHRLVNAAGIAVVVALLAWHAPSGWSVGARVGGGVALGIPTLFAAGQAVLVGLGSVTDAAPWWHENRSSFDGSYEWSLPVALLLLTISGIVLSKGLGREWTVAGGVAALALALPGQDAVTAWAPSAVDLLVVAGALIWILWRVTDTRSLAPWSVVVGSLSLHAMLSGMGTPTRSALVLGVIVLFSIATAVLAPRHDAVKFIAPAGVFLGVALFPLVVQHALAASHVSPALVWRGLLAAVVLSAAATHLISPSYREPAVWAVMLIGLWPLWPFLPIGESRAIYAAVAAAAVLAAATRSRTAVALAPAMLWCGMTVLHCMKSIYEVYLRPLETVSNIWQGVPDGDLVPFTHAIALTLVLVALAGAVSLRMGRQRSVLIGFGIAAVFVIPVWLTAIELPWPAVPAVMLLGGLGLLIVASRRHELAAVAGVPLVIAGLGGSLAHEWSTITALALISVVMNAIGVAGRTTETRIAGWITGALAKVLLAIAVGNAAELHPQVTAYLVLLVAAVVLGIAYTPLVRDQRAAVEASAHSAALVALSLCAGNLNPTAGVLAIWGVAIGLTVLVSPARQRIGRAAVAGGLEMIAWWVLLRAMDIETLEAYTLPVAVVAMGIGIYSGQVRAGLSSWQAFGPALAAGLLPSLAAALVDPTPVRRIVLGAGALAVVVAGAKWRRQAPVVLGGSVLVVLALQELVFAAMRRLLPLYVPLSIGGALLVFLAITFERRRRDLARLRDAISTMQ